ncbi:hypothetical protein ACJIZ3_010960 [Penstemon smallii]|uniref:Uncharacterized protein n=1 Tax=Penstemon smallii TaxID=265156 RepID=A0ABD3UM14_9LAMI
MGFGSISRNPRDRAKTHPNTAIYSEHNYKLQYRSAFTIHVVALTLDYNYRAVASESN